MFLLKSEFHNILGSYNTQLRDNAHQRTGIVNSELRARIKRDHLSQRTKCMLTHECERK